MTQRMLEKTTQEERLREKALAREKFQWDISSNMIGSYRRGLREGLEEGLAQGRTEGVKEGIRLIAARMKESGKSVEEIAAVSGLSPEEIDVL